MNGLAAGQWLDCPLVNTGYWVAQSFIGLKERICPLPAAKELLRGIDWRVLCQATAASRSLSKHEVAINLAAASSA